MARGESGRVVVEVDPELKAALYSVLAKSGTTLKDWFLGAARQFVDSQTQPSLFGTSGSDPVSVAEPEPSYVANKSKKKGKT